MSLDLYLEADKELTVPILELALEKAGAFEVYRLDGVLKADFISGLALTVDGATTDPTVYAEDRKGTNFHVAIRCSLRIKGPEPEGQSSMEDLDKVATFIAQSCSSLFLITFQFEETLYWRDKTGLHRT